MYFFAPRVVFASSNANAKHASPVLRKRWQCVYFVVKGSRA